MSHTPRRHYTREEQVEAWIADLLADADHAKAQAESGPFYPDRGITPESLHTYAAECRRQAADPEATLREALRGSGTPL